MVNVSLVGFGRVGRDIFRQTLEEDNINIVSVSDTADKDNLIYLLKYDSIYGKWGKNLCKNMLLHAVIVSV